MLLCLCSILSCKKQQHTAKSASLKIVIDESLGEKLIIPDSLEVYDPFESSRNTKESSKPRLKIYSSIDASCGTCIESLKIWNQLIPEFNKKNVQVNLICSSDNKFDLLKYFFESKEIKNFTHPLLLDHKNHYLKQNRFMNESKNFETVLTNNENTILLIGNPIASNKMKELYFNEIKKYQNEK